MDAYFESLRRSNNIRSSQIVLVEDKAALPASELLEQVMQPHEDESSSSSDQSPRRMSSASLDIRALTSQHSFNQEDAGSNMEDLNKSTWLLNLSESSIVSRHQCSEEISKSDTISKNKPQRHSS